KIKRLSAQLYRCADSLIDQMNPLHLEPVAHSPDGLNILWISCIHFYLLTDLLDMHRDSGDISDRLHVPDLAEQFIFSIHMIGVTCKKSQQIELLCRKILFLSVDPHPAGCGV